VAGVSFYNGFSPDERLAKGTAAVEHMLQLLTRAAFCIACGGDSGPVDLHAEDYSQPIYWEPRWRLPLCYRCHMIVHCRHRNPQGFDAYRAELREGRRWPTVPNRAISIVFAENLNATRRPGPLEGDPKILVLRDGVEYPVWKKPVLDMIADGGLCPPGRLPGNSKNPTKVLPRHKLLPEFQDWSIAKIIRKVERQPWLPIVKSRVSARQWRPWRGSPRSSDYRSIQERFDWDETNVTVRTPEGGPQQ
jgi:hypothetical protein